MGWVGVSIYLSLFELIEIDRRKIKKRKQHESQHEVREKVTQHTKEQLEFEFDDVVVVIAVVVWGWCRHHQGSHTSEPDILWTDSTTITDNCSIPLFLTITVHTHTTTTTTVRKKASSAITRRQQRKDAYILFLLLRTCCTTNNSPDSWSRINQSVLNYFQKRISRYSRCIVWYQWVVVNLILWVLLPTITLSMGVLGFFPVIFCLYSYRWHKIWMVYGTHCIV